MGEPSAVLVLVASPIKRVQQAGNVPRGVKGHNKKR
jgi:hypothetical protein